MEEGSDDVSSDHKERMAVPQAGPGIMLLTTSMRLLYKDRRAWDLCRQIIRCQDGKALLRVSLVFASGMIRLRGLGSARSTTPARVDRHAPPPVQAESRR